MGPSTWGAGSAGAGWVGVVVVCVGVVVVSPVGAVVVWPCAGATMLALSAMAIRDARAKPIMEKDLFVPKATEPPARRHTMVSL